MNGVEGDALLFMVFQMMFAIASYTLARVVKAITGLRVDEDQEHKGLDISLHEERGHVLTEQGTPTRPSFSRADLDLEVEISAPKRVG